jgi:hypothetical protein
LLDGRADVYQRLGDWWPGQYPRGCHRKQCYSDVP